MTPPPWVSALQEVQGQGCGRGEQAGRWGRQETQTQVLSPRTHSVRVGPGVAKRSGVILFTRPVDVLEQSHGEGHSQDLKDKERTLKGCTCGLESDLSSTSSGQL